MAVPSDVVPNDILPSNVGPGGCVRLAPQTPHLALSRLSVTQFRCYQAADLVLDGRPVVLVGPNGAGKTAILEAVSLLAPGRGLRGATSAELLRKDPQADKHRDWAVSALLTVVDAQSQRDETRMGTGTKGTDRRVARIDGAATASASDFTAHLRLAWLTPAMDRLFLEGASGRRKFFDRLVLGAVPSHGREAAQYEQAMRERSRLLKDGRTDDSWLSALEERMACHGIAVARARARFCDDVQAAIEAAPDSPFPKAQLALDGALEAQVLQADETALIGQFRMELAHGRQRDARAGRALSGPHRTDLQVTHAPKAMAAGDCSTGEQKALLVGMILANARLRMAEDGRPPIILLDEIAAHLDEARRRALFDQICALGIQSFMTGTDLSLFQALEGRAQVLHVANGEIHDPAAGAIARAD